MQQDNNPKNTSHSTKEWLKKNKVNVLERLGQSPDLNPIKMSWKDRSKQFIGEKPPTSNEFFSYCSKGGHTRYWQQRFTYFWNAHICNTGSFLTNIWTENICQRKYICLFRASLSTFWTNIWWCFGSYLCRNIDNSKGFTNFQAALYIAWYKIHCMEKKSLYIL